MDIKKYIRINGENFDLPYLAKDDGRGMIHLEVGDENYHRSVSFLSGDEVDMDTDLSLKIIVDEEFVAGEYKDKIESAFEGIGESLHETKDQLKRVGSEEEARKQLDYCVESLTLVGNKIDELIEIINKNEECSIKAYSGTVKEISKRFKEFRQEMVKKVFEESNKYRDKIKDVKNNMPSNSVIFAGDIQGPYVFAEIDPGKYLICDNGKYSVVEITGDYQVNEGQHNLLIQRII